jgi:tetratricopeptide (TPR) repeat protein
MAKRKPSKEALKHIEVSKYGEDEWSFDYPRITLEVEERLYEAIELYRSEDSMGAKRRFKGLIKEFPEFIDAYHHLALAMDDLGEPYESFNQVETATEMGLRSLPVNFYFGRDRLPWLSLENRPFLRAYHYYGLKHLSMDEIETALCIFNNILDLNPNDNQGVRALVIQSYLSMKRPLDVLRIVDRFPDDGLADSLYGKILALFQLDRIKKAKKSLKEAAKLLPLVAKEISKKQHRKPKLLNPGFSTFGGEDEAYYFWQANAQNWKDTPGAIEFMREYLSRKD